MYRIEYACINTKGKVRESNQDNFYAQGRYRYGTEKHNDISVFGSIEDKENSILAVYDGMGGESCGDMASLVAAGATVNFDKIPGNGRDVLLTMAVKQNSLILEYAAFKKIDRMGSTLAAVRFSAEDMCFCNLGDSRIYKISPYGISRLSVDHTAKNYFEQKAPLTQYLGLPTDEFMIDPHITQEKYANGIKYLLCSDGITDMVDEKTIYDIVSSANDLKSACAFLVEDALEAGGHDNITAMLFEVIKNY